MASPHKIRKESQASKLTSTPQRLTSGVVPSPDLSCIAFSSSSDIASKSSKTLTPPREQVPASQVSVNFGASTASSHLSLLSDHCFEVGSELNYDEFFSNLPRVDRTGRIWKLYRPLDEDTLYSRILSNPDIAEEHVTEFLQTFQSHPKDGVYHLLKLCLDLCGYQKFDFLKYYKFPRINLEEIFEVTKYEECGAEVFTTKTYLLAEPETHLAHVFKMAIYNFIAKLVIKAEGRGILYQANFRIFLEFVDSMIKHKMRPIAHTGAILAMKILSAMCMINYEVMNTSGFVSLAIQEKNRKYVNNFMDIFFMRTKKICLLPHEKSDMIRIIFAHEMCLWLAYLPEKFINEYCCLAILKKFSHGDTKKVRLAALESFQKLLENRHLTGYKQIPELFPIVEGLFYDVDTSVALKALETFKTAIAHYSSYIVGDNLQILVKLVYDQNYVFAKAAAPCILEIMRKTNIAEENMVLKLVTIAKTMPEPHKPLLVEAFIECMPELTNWKRFVRILSTDSVAVDAKITLCELFAESVHQTLVGVSTKPRTSSRKVLDVPPEEHMELAQIFFPVATKLICKYHSHPTILRDLLKIVLLIDVEEDNTKVGEPIADTIGLIALPDLCIFGRQYNLGTEGLDICSLYLLFEFYIEIVEVNNRVFAVNSDQVLLETAADLLLRMHDHDIALESITALLTWYAKKFFEGAKSATDYMEVVLKMTILFARFDLSNYDIQWETLSDNWDTSAPEVTASLMICCKWYLIWGLKKSSGDKEAISTLTFYRNGFLRELGICIKKSDLQMAAYTQLCDFILRFTEELVKIGKTRTEFKELKLNFEDKDSGVLGDMREILESFVENIIASKRGLLDDRKKCVRDFIALVFNAILPCDSLSVVFKHYKSRNEEYGNIIELAIKQLLDADAAALAAVVTDTLTSTFGYLRRKRGAFDARSSATRTVLRNLVQQFVTCKEMQTPKVAGYLLFFSVNFALKDVPGHFPFLSFVVCFIEFVHNKTKLIEIRDRVKKSVPKGYEKDGSLLYFAKHLDKKIKDQEALETSLALFKKPQAVTRNQEKKDPQQRGRKPKKGAGIENKDPQNQRGGPRSKRVLNEETSETGANDVNSVHDGSSDDDLSRSVSRMSV